MQNFRDFGKLLNMGLPHTRGATTPWQSEPSSHTLKSKFGAGVGAEMTNAGSNGFNSQHPSAITWLVSHALGKPSQPQFKTYRRVEWKGL